MDTLKRTTWNFYTGSQLTFGPRAVATLAGVITRNGARRVFVLTDTVLEEAGVLAPVRDALESTSARVQYFTGGEVEPSTRTVEQAAALAQQHKPDLFLAVGGGSNMDLAKACRAVVENDCSAESLIGFDNVPARGPTLVCVPTTSGTGSEVSHAAVLRNSSTGEKGACHSQNLRPDIAVVDPYLTVTCPKKITAESGIDALTHAIEAYLVSNFYQLEDDADHGLAYEGNNPFGDLLAEKAIRLIGRHLRKAVDEPEDLGARSAMALAATFAGAAFSNCGVGLAHALEYPIGHVGNCSHGAGNGIVLPGVMRYLKEHRAARIARIGELFNSDRSEKSTEESAEIAIESVAKLRDAIGLPARLRDVGISRDQLPDLSIAAHSLRRLMLLTPGPPSEEDCLEILRACY